MLAMTGKDEEERRFLALLDEEDDDIVEEDDFRLGENRDDILDQYLGEEDEEYYDETVMEMGQLG